MGFPKQVAIFTVSWDNIGDPDETMKVHWNYEFKPGQFQVGTKQFLVGTDCFLEDPTAGNSLQGVSDEQLLAAIGMNAILAGALPGTVEFTAAIGEQSTVHFQTIVGNAKLKVDPVPVVDPSYGPLGTVYDLTFMRVGQSTNTKVVRADAWAISQYSNREDSPTHAAPCVPGAIHKQLALKKSQLGASGSANRTAVENFVATQKFWV